MLNAIDAAAAADLNTPKVLATLQDALRDPAGLGQLVERSLRDLAETRRGAVAGAGRSGPGGGGGCPAGAGGFQPRADLLAELDAPSGGRVRVVHAVTGMRGVGKTQLAAAYARARIDEEWRLVAWVNAENRAAVLGGLAEVAAALGLDAGAGDAAAGRAVRGRLEAGGDRCLLVFDNAADPADLLPFLPAAGAARVLVTSNERPVGELGAGLAVDVFSWEEAVAFLAGRTGSDDAAGARLLAGELGRLPLALAQAAAVIAAQHLDYPAYLARLRAKPVVSCCSGRVRAGIRMGWRRRCCWRWTRSGPGTVPGCAAR